jgi:hypothetical protein
MELFSGMTLKVLASKYKAWQNWVNDENYYSIRNTEIVAGDAEYLMFVWFTKP